MNTSSFHLPVSSSWIASVTFHDGFLLITRKDSTGTLYSDISPEVACELAGIDSETGERRDDHSVGKAFHRLFVITRKTSLSTIYPANYTLRRTGEKIHHQSLNSGQTSEAITRMKGACVS